jgi:hypothetical protein
MQTKQLNELFTDYPDGLYCLIRVTVNEYNGKAKLQFMHFESLGKGIPGFVAHFDKLPLTFDGFLYIRDIAALEGVNRITSGDTVYLK